MTAQELTKVVGRHADTLEDLRKDVAHLEVEVKMLRSDVDRCYVTRKRSRMKEGD